MKCFMKINPQYKEVMERNKNLEDKKINEMHHMKSLQNKEIEQQMKINEKKFKKLVES